MENQNLPPYDVSKDVLQFPFEKDRQSLKIGPEKDLLMYNVHQTTADNSYDCFLCLSICL